MNDKREADRLMLMPQDCHDCGLCCMHMATPPFNNPFSQNALKLKPWVFSVRRAWADEQPCIWLDQVSGSCRNYNRRPKICRNFEVGGINCMRYRFMVAQILMRRANHAHPTTG